MPSTSQRADSRPLTSVCLFCCPRCKNLLPDSLNCPTCEFQLADRNGVLVALPETSDGAFEDYAVGSGLPSYTTGPLIDNAYFTRFFPLGAKTVMDAGSGDANASAHWAATNPDGHLYAVDCDEGALQRALRRNLPNLTTIKAPSARTPFPDGFFDAVISVYMVEHMYDWELSEFYHEALRVLRPGGTLIITSDAPFFDKFIHPVLRLIRNRNWRTSSFLERWQPSVRSIRHHNLKTARTAAADIARHGFFVQGFTVPLLFSNFILAAAFHEVLNGILPKAFIERFLGTSYTVVARKP
jgi:SAM-dependent methyltransferase